MKWIGYSDFRIILPDRASIGRSDEKPQQSEKMKVTFLRACLGLSFSLLSWPLLAQQSIPQMTRLDESVANINLDGFVDEAVWDYLPVIDGMKVINPDTLADAVYETHIRMF